MEASTPITTISGDTFPHKDAIKGLPRACWLARRRRWEVCMHAADVVAALGVGTAYGDARVIITTQRTTQRTQRTAPAGRKCTCGSQIWGDDDRCDYCGGRL